MRTTLFRLLAVASAFGMISCSKHPEVHIEVKLDAEERPLEVFSYVLDNDGAKIRHGESLKYEWATGVVRREHYQNGALVDGDFETSANVGSSVHTAPR